MERAAFYWWKAVNSIFCSPIFTHPVTTLQPEIAPQLLPTRLWVPAHTKARERTPPQTSLCLGPADFCSCRTDDRPSPDPLEPLLMGGLARLTPANPPGPLLALFVEGGDVLLDPVGFGGLRRWDCQSGWPRLGWGICFCYSVPWGLRGPAVVSCSPWQLCRRE